MAKKAKQILAQNLISVSHLARAAGLSVRSLLHLFAGDRDTTLDTKRRVVAALNSLLAMEGKKTVGPELFSGDEVEIVWDPKKGESIQCELIPVGDGVRLEIASRPKTARAYEEVIEFIANETNPHRLVAFQPSGETRTRVAHLTAREKTAGLSPDEKAELDHYMHLEHVMRLAKARARKHLMNE